MSGMVVGGEREQGQVVWSQRVGGRGWVRRAVAVADAQGEV